MIPAWGSEIHLIQRGTAMKSRYLIAAIVIATCTYLLISHRNGGADETPKRDGYFKTRFILLNAGDQVGAYLENPELRVLGGRTFIVGKAAGVNKKWKLVGGVTIWWPMDVVTLIMEYNSLDEIRESAAAFETPPKDSRD
jgi:hypothetical protein